MASGADTRTRIGRRAPGLKCVGISVGIDICTATKVKKQLKNTEDPDTEIIDKSLIPTFGLLLTY